MQSNVFTDEQLKGMNPAEYRMATQNIRTLILQYSIPTIIGMTVNAMYNVVNRFWVGKIPGIGSDALTGIGLCMPAMNIMMAFAQLIGIGAAAAISISLGRKDRQSAERILSNALSLIIILGSLFIAAAVFFNEPILRLLGADDKTLPYAQPYYLITTGFSIFWMVSFAMNHPIRGMGNPKRFASTQLLGGFANIILDPLFIFGFDMGIKGAAIATVISQAMAAIWVMSYYFTGASPVPLKTKYLKPHIPTAISIFAIGLSPFLMQILGSVVSLIANRTLKYYGDLAFGDGNAAIGAMTVINSVGILFLMPLFGINQGSQPIIGFNYGSGAIDRVKAAYKWSLIYAIALCSVGFVVSEVFAVQLVRIFNDDPLLVSIGSFGLRVAFCVLPLVAVQIQSTNFLQSIGRAKIAIFLSMLRQCLLLIPCFFIFPIFFGFNGIWFAMPFSDALAMAITVFFIIKEFKRLDANSVEKKIA